MKGGRISEESLHFNASVALRKADFKHQISCILRKPNDVSIVDIYKGVGASDGD